MTKCVSILRFTSEGDMEWYYKDRLHREDGPAIIWTTGTKEWYFHGRRHREDGPAIEYSSGILVWWLHGVEMTELEHFNRSKYFKNLPPSERVRLRLMIQ